jgi:hypothetical protein
VEDRIFGATKKPPKQRIKYPLPPYKKEVLSRSLGMLSRHFRAETADHSTQITTLPSRLLHHFTARILPGMKTIPQMTDVAHPHILQSLGRQS